MKIGRNDPCPCGSGKKYKKCCALKPKEPDFSLPEDIRTGTPFDEYVLLLEGIALYYQVLLDYDNDKKALVKAVKDFEKQFQPGTEQGVNDSLYMPWLYFDLRYGRSGKTVCERFLESDMIKQLNEPGPTLIRIMSESYTTFYRVEGLSKKHIQFYELGTGAVWRVHRINEPEETDIREGDIWYVRFVGPFDDAYIFSAPYVFPPESNDQFSLAVKRQRKIAEKENVDGLPQEAVFKETCKKLLPLWAYYIHKGDIEVNIGMPEAQPSVADMPAIYNTDGQALRFCKIVFKIIEDEGLREKLTSMAGFDYDERNKTWIWFKKGNDKLSIFPTTTLGTVTIKRGYLIGETNSEERAIKLMNKIKRSLEDFVSFEKIEAKNLDEMPPLTEKQKLRIQKEQEELMKNPEAREAARRMIEEYYYNDWLKAAIPALGNQTPLEAIKKPEGKRAVKKLLDDLEVMQNRNPGNAFQIDVNNLRKRLNIEVDEM